jgi:hypothetical protein
MNRFSIFQKKGWPSWTPDSVALIGLVIYFVQAMVFAHTTISNLDEGAYLLKGILFATGKYHPFDPGISTNKAPLAFLIPGYVQFLFGPGLRTGRYLAVFFGAMAVLGTWIASRRIGGKWLAAGAVWVFAFSPTIIKIYSGGATQSAVACLLAWSLALSLGEKRPFWQLMLSGLLAGLMMLVRENMMPVLPLLAVYAFWQHGWKSVGLLISGLAVVVAVHIMYWPEILRLWYWVPFIQHQLPVQAVYSGGGSIIWRPRIFLDSRLLSIFQAFRFHFVPLVGSVFSLLLWPKLSAWKSRADFRMSLFLLLLFWGLLYMHAMASIARDFCVFCFTPYIAFFNVIGVLLLVVSVKSWNWRPSIAAQILLVAGLVILFTGMGFSAFEDIGRSLLYLPVPRIRDYRILPGFLTWWELLSNKFHVNRYGAMRYISAAFGFSVGISIIVISYIIWRRAWRDSSVKFAAFLASTVLVVELFISPVLHGSAGTRDCASDVILANEQIGDHLKGIIPHGSLVYWDGGLSAAPFLYLPGVKIFPPQINDGYSFVSNGDTAELFKFGYWNEEMEAEWKATADFFIIEDKRYNDWKGFLSPEQFDEFARSPVGTSCLEGSTLRIFRRK